MKGINYLFNDFAELASRLETQDEDQELQLPDGVGADLYEGEWVLASVNVGDDSLGVAACCVDRGDGLQLSFKERDWEALWRFAERQRMPTIPPSLPPPPCTEMLKPSARVLYVDQDVETQEVVRGLLGAGGFDVTCVPSAEHAFDTLRLQEVDAVILEVNLPGMNGVDFCRRVRRDRRFSSLPLVLLSTTTSSDAVLTAFASGADDYVAKPFRAPELSARICCLLRRTRAPAHAS